MVSKTVELVIIWVIGVVAFFALWAVLAKVTQRISERRHQKELTQEDDDQSNNDLASSER